MKNHNRNAVFDYAKLGLVKAGFNLTHLAG